LSNGDDVGRSGVDSSVRTGGGAWSGLADLHLVVEIEVTRLDLLLLFLGKQLFDALSVFAVVRLF
jgi:hypothetical protein